VVRVRDTTAGADRLLAAITWSGSTPSVAMTTGIYVATVMCYDGVHRLLFQTASVTAANANQIEIYPATDAALATTDTGTLYVGGVMAENFRYPRAYVKTLGSTVSTAGDVLTCPFTQPLADFTVYARLARPVWADLSPIVPPGIVSYTPDTTGGWYVEYASTPGFVIAFLYDNAHTLATAIGEMPASGVFELAAQFGTLRTAPAVRIDVGSGFSAWSATTLVPMTSWGGATTLSVGQLTIAADQANAGVRRIAIVGGLQTLSALRGAQP
jgi:hypothetical protein